ncbi:response regulator [Actinopolymorpha singaporensis]|uniref:DNA-binding response regulator, NarL/FixJ family, contains REC and HTH domains n=1 Tax=Actinopolymorpha singaporensis TaxID=117157 RepID=A0A1H1XHN3_9ACTN|nr:response regulator transcription factor [Actinopolymorpha singaporensis]SDT08758.1 DNA-binding response regulator, NarL/FixJ family, contains REC and HTH domains [Actinopolymorpha singaporensis]
MSDTAPGSAAAAGVPAAAGKAGPIRVLVVDDHQVVRHGLRTFLDIQDDIEVVGEAGDGGAAVELAETLRPDLMLLDLQLPGVDGVSALRMLRDRGSTVRVLVLTSFTEPATVVPALRAGAAGYLFKDVDPEALAQAIRAVHAGQVLLEPEVADALLRGDDPAERAGGALTEREREVLVEIAHGRSNREIARALVLSEKTVKTHVSSILAKLGLADRTQAALYAVRRGLA